MLIQELKKCFSADASLVLLLCVCLLGMGFHWYRAYTPYMGDDYYPADYISLVDSCLEADQKGLSLEEMETEYSLASEDVKQEWEDIFGYSEYIETVTQERFFGLQKESGYQTKLREKYRSHYKGLSGLKPEFAGNRGILLFSAMDICDALLLFGILLILFRVVTVDREIDMEPLLFCTKNGTFRLYQYKWLAGSIFTAGFALLFYLMKLFLYVRAYGFQNWTGYLQSVPGYLSADIPLRIWQFVLLVLLGKVFVIWLLYSVFYQINYSICSYRTAFLVDLLLCGISIVLYIGINPNSYLANLRLLSPMRLLDLGNLWAGYDPISIFGYPVSYRFLWGVLCVILFTGILYLMGSYRCYQKRNPLPVSTEKKKQRKWSLLSRISGFSLFAWEWKKWLKLERGIYLLLALVFLVLATYRLPQESLGTREDQYYKALVLEYHGKVTENQCLKAAAELEELELLEQDMLEHGDQYTATAYQVAEDKIKKIPALKRLIAYQKYVGKGQGRQIVYEKGYEMLFGKAVLGGYLKWCNILGIIFLCLFSESLWGMEKCSGMDGLCPTTLVGMKKINHRKVLTLLLISVLTGLLVYLPWIYMAAQSYPMQDWNVAVNSLRIFRLLSHMSIGVVLALYYSLHIIYLFALGMTMKVIRNRINSSIVAILAGCLIGLLPCLWIS